MSSKIFLHYVTFPSYRKSNYSCALIPKEGLQNDLIVKNNKLFDRDVFEGHLKSFLAMYRRIGKNKYIVVSCTIMDT